MARQQASQPFAPWGWIGAPMLLCIGVTVLLAAPFRLLGLGLPEPVFAMAPAFAWAVIRPSLLGPFALLILGLFCDLFWGGPAGLWASALLVVYFLALFGRPLMAGQSSPVLWAWYVAGCILAFGLVYLFTLVDSGEPPNLIAVGLQFLVTAALYPLAHRLIDRFEDADVRFR